VHLAYLDAGADCIVTSSYQASIAGLVARGLSKDDASLVLRRSVELAIEARELYLERPNSSDVRRPLVAASIGPYGAALADGSEYDGHYGVPRDVLKEFHEQRWTVLADTHADLFACETIPSFAEAEVLRELIDQSPGVFAWISFSCRDGERISDGTPISECAALFEGQDRVVALGVNCTAPAHVSSLIDRLREASSKPVVVYPNSGEAWDAVRREWIGTSDPTGFATMTREWHDRGARLIGGCCRIGPRHIAETKAALEKSR
jgi:homocysteine S-methyltransferase